MNAHVATYTFNPRALQRWRAERLSLVARADGGAEAAFRYDGSTCGNCAFTLIYRVTLGPAGEGHPLRELGCTPAPGSDGQERMCSYLATQGRILETADAEKPLLGRPLAAVLDWRPATSPAGCLCTAALRDHKWLAVLETLHFALLDPGKVSSIK
jgi:hypothetical protein